MFFFIILAPGDYNIPAELIKNGGEAMISALTITCNKIWQTGDKVYDQDYTPELLLRYFKNYL